MVHGSNKDPKASAIYNDEDYETVCFSYRAYNYGFARKFR